MQALQSYAARREREHGHAPFPEESNDGIEMRPANAYEAVTRQKVESLQEDLREIKGRLNTLLIALVGGVVLDVLARWVSQ